MRNRNRQFTEIIAGILILAVIALVILFARGAFLTTTIVGGNQAVDGNQSTIAFMDGDASVAGSYVRIGKKGENFYSLLLQLTHNEGSEIDSILIEISSNDPLPIALEASTYAWESMEYHFTEGNNNVIVSIPEPGIYGEGTIDLEFLLGPYPPDIQPSPVFMNISFDMHDEGFNLIRRKFEAQGVMEIELPALASF